MFKGYSIGNWLDTDGDGRYDTLEVETRDIKGPRAYDTSGLPLHKDNKTVVKEKIYLDKADRNVLLDEITTIDNALTRPWTVKKKYTRDRRTRGTTGSRKSAPSTISRCASATTTSSSAPTAC